MIATTYMHGALGVSKMCSILAMAETHFHTICTIACLTDSYIASEQLGHILISYRPEAGRSVAS